MMQCPKCAGQTEIATYDETKVDRCTRCGGLWFDTGELATAHVESKGGRSSRQPDEERPGTENATDDHARGRSYLADSIGRVCGHGSELDGGAVHQQVHVGQIVQLVQPVDEVGLIRWINESNLVRILNQVALCGLSHGDQMIGRATSL